MNEFKAFVNSVGKTPNPDEPLVPSFVPKIGPALKRSGAISARRCASKTESSRDKRHQGQDGEAIVDKHPYRPQPSGSSIPRLPRELKSARRSHSNPVQVSSTISFSCSDKNAVLANNVSRFLNNCPSHLTLTCESKCLSLSAVDFPVPPGYPAFDFGPARSSRHCLSGSSRSTRKVINENALASRRPAVSRDIPAIWRSVDGVKDSNGLSQSARVKATAKPLASETRKPKTPSRPPRSARCPLVTLSTNCRLL